MCKTYCSYCNKDRSPSTQRITERNKLFPIVLQLMLSQSFSSQLSFWIEFISPAAYSKHSRITVFSTVLCFYDLIQIFNAFIHFLISSYLCRFYLIIIKQSHILSLCKALWSTFVFFLKTCSINTDLIWTLVFHITCSLFLILPVYLPLFSSICFNNVSICKLGLRALTERLHCKPGVGWPALPAGRC